MLPGPLRRRLGIRPGDPLDVKIKDGGIFLAPREKKPRVARIIDDPISGLPVLYAGPDAPVLTSEQVREMLAEFP